MNIRLLFLCFILLSCSATRMHETVLYFGLSKPDGTVVSEQEWNNFRDNYISRIFPEGYSVVQTEGAWKDTLTKKIIKEPTFQVIYYYPKSPAISQQIDSLRIWYQKLFQQQSVLRVDRKVKAAF